MKPLCIYHSNCADGFAAAWVVRKFFNGEVDFYPGIYQNNPPNVTDRDVIFVDFSYKKPVLEEMARQARSILILDHHKSASEDLADNLIPVGDFQFVEWLRAGALNLRMAAVFDMEHSGSGLTWDFLFPGKPRPALINHIEDRDLWRFKLPWTREIQACVFSYPYDFDVWDWLMREPVEALAKEGYAIERKHFKDIDELLKVVTRPMNIGGYIVPMANLPYTLTSDAGHALAAGKPFAGCYWDTPDGRVFSLRSQDDGLDVSEIAKQYGGGGHAHASGFKVGYADLKQFEIA